MEYSADEPIDDDNFTQTTASELEDAHKVRLRNAIAQLGKKWS